MSEQNVYAHYRSPVPEAVPLTSTYPKGDGVACNRHAYREIAHTLAPST